MNWRHQIDSPVTVRVRGAGEVSRAESLATQSTLAAAVEDGALTFTLPRLDEGDIVLLE